MERQGKKRLVLAILIIAIFVYALFTWFLPTLIAGLSVFNRFKPVFVKEIPISENTTLAPPVLNIPYEATNTAKIKIRGYSSPYTKVEIYLDEGLQTTAESQEDGSFTSEAIILSLGTNDIFGKTIDDKGSRSLPSKPIRIIYTNEKPKLEIRAPEDNQTIRGDKKILVLGTVEANKDIAVSVNGIRAIVTPEGNFSQGIELNDGENEIKITATDLIGNTTQMTRRVIYEP